MPRLVEIAPVVFKKMLKMRNVYRPMDRRTDRQQTKCELKRKEVPTFQFFKTMIIFSFMSNTYNIDYLVIRL